MPKWESLILDPTSVSALPSPHVVKFARKFKKSDQTKVLDIGCGRGRHAIFLAKQCGFEVFALDSIEVALEITIKKAEEKNVNIKTVKADSMHLPFEDCFFDGVVAINVINHGTLDDVVSSLAEINRVLKNGGLFLSTLLSKKDFRFGQGDSIAPHTFILKNDPEAGVAHTFFDESMIFKLYSSFLITEIYEEKNVIRDHKISYRWIINALKV